MRTSFTIGMLALGLLHTAACSKAEPGSLYVLNGFDFPVKVAIKTADANVTLDIPARGMVRTSAGGEGTVKVTTASGSVVDDDRTDLGRAKRPEGCLRVYNIQGAAAVVEEDVVYGESFGTPHYSLRAGETTDEYCGIGWAFVQPPESITVDSAGPNGRNISWLHYLDDGGWATSVNALLAQGGEFRSQYRGAAQAIVEAVVKSDPTNPALAGFRERFAAELLVFPDGK